VKVFLRRQSDDFYWNGQSFVAKAFALSTDYPVGAKSGNWKVTSTLPSGAQLSENRYVISAQAFDKAGNSIKRNATFTSHSAAPAGVSSPVVLSSATVGSARDTIVLTFTGALSQSATEINRYTLAVNGASVTLQSASLQGNTITLTLQDALQSGDAIWVRYDLCDEKNRAVQGETSLRVP
jgi:hypothetical protein